MRFNDRNRNQATDKKGILDAWLENNSKKRITGWIIRTKERGNWNENGGMASSLDRIDPHFWSFPKSCGAHAEGYTKQTFSRQFRGKTSLKNHKIFNSISLRSLWKNSKHGMQMPFTQDNKTSRSTFNI